MLPDKSSDSLSFEVRIWRSVVVGMHTQPSLSIRRHRRVGRDFVPVNKGYNEPANESDDGHCKQQTVVTLHLDAKDGEMADDGAAKCAQCENAASPTQARSEE